MLTHDRYIYYVMFGRYYTVDSKLIIHRKNFQEGLDRIKRMDRSFHDGGREEIQKATSFGQALYKLGWSAIYSPLPLPYIRGLVYRRSDEFTRDSRYVLYVIANIVEPGGFIKFVDTKTDNAKVYRFNNNSLTQNYIHKKYVDIKSEQDLLELLEFSIDRLFEMNKVPKDLIGFIKRKYIERILDL